jgi:1,4-alpha-glucan branching enzyme
VATPSLSSWGEKGYGDYWCNGSNAWVYRHLHKMAERMVELAHRFPEAKGIARRALDQAAREVMLAQSSDWAFIMKTGTTVPYATKRTNDHVRRFTRIYEALVGDHPIDEAWLAEVESRDNLFPEMDHRIYGS